MKSVDALRKWADGLSCIWIDPNDHSIIVTTCDDMPPSIDCVNLREHVNAILDEIEHDVDDMWHALTIDAKPMTDENMAKSGWVRLPVDADGVPIHVGDVMENIVCPSVHREVTGVGVECFYGWDEGNGRYSQFDVACYRHHHAPTVEDVLEEFVARWMETHHDDIPALKAEYAAKLRLAGDE